MPQRLVRQRDRPVPLPFYELALRRIPTCRRAKLQRVEGLLARFASMQSDISEGSVAEYHRLRALHAELRSSSRGALDTATSVKYLVAIGYPLGSFLVEHPELLLRLL